MSFNEIRADKEIIEQFITEITKDWLEVPVAGIFEIRCLGEHKTPITQIFTLEAVAEAVDFALQINATKMNVYMIAGLNPPFRPATTRHNRHNGDHPSRTQPRLLETG